TAAAGGTAGGAATAGGSATAGGIATAGGTATAGGIATAGGTATAGGAATAGGSADAGDLCAGYSTNSDAGLLTGATDAGCGFESTFAFCNRYGAQCGSFTALDLCGSSRTENCGSQCFTSFPTTCGGGGVANLCGCTQLPDDVQCRGVFANCGTLVRADFRCANPHCVASCGTCTGGASCGGNGIANVCAIPGCVPESDTEFCARVGGAAQPAPDNCGVPRVAWCGAPSLIVFTGYDAGVFHDLDAGIHCVSGQVPLNRNCIQGITVSPNLAFTTYTSVTFQPRYGSAGPFLGPFESSTLPGMVLPSGVTPTLLINDRSVHSVAFNGLSSTGTRDRTHLVLGVNFTRSAPLGTDCGQWVVYCYGKAQYFLPP
ncbi:MAG: hypothetical protein GQE15_33715, partial [Archangiaceae bacterium]|nr:hypothetical protein [Archangiaceae bacterium]